MLSVERMDWLERNGIEWPTEYSYVSQDSDTVTLRHRKSRKLRTLRKDLRNSKF